MHLNLRKWETRQHKRPLCHQSNEIPAMKLESISKALVSARSFWLSASGTQKLRDERERTQNLLSASAN